MFRIISLMILLSATVGLFVMTPVWAEENSVTLSVSSLSKFGVGQNPFVKGTVIDSNGNPLSNVEIQANFPSSVGIAVTNSAGEFSITSQAPAEHGEHVITVYATKDTLYLDTQVIYQVGTSNESLNNNNTNSEEKNSKTSNYDNSQYDLLSRTILKNIEEQKIDNQKREDLSEEQEAISEQRLQIHSELKNELESFEKEYESNTPRNAFLGFLTEVDSSVKDIFWHQFLFTEERTDDAREAKEYALEEGKSSIEATEVFREKATIRQSEINEYNNELNIKYGNATSSVQEQFDENGKLPREE